MTIELTTAGIAVAISALGLLYGYFKDRRSDKTKAEDRESLKKEIRENCISELTQKIALMEQTQQEHGRQLKAMFTRIDEHRVVNEKQGKQITAIITAMRIKNNIDIKGDTDED